MTTMKRPFMLKNICECTIINSSSSWPHLMIHGVSNLVFIFLNTETLWESHNMISHHRFFFWWGQHGLLDIWQKIEGKVLYEEHGLNWWRAAQMMNCTNEDTNNKSFSSNFLLFSRSISRYRDQNVGCCWNKRPVIGGWRLPILAVLILTSNFNLVLVVF